MNKICRVCLDEGSGVLSSIFTRNYNISLSSMLEYCCNMTIRKNDGLSEHICSNCVYKLGISYNFKQTYESADIRLRQYLGLPATNKKSEVAVMTDPIPVQTQVIVKKCKCQLSKNKKPSTNYKKKAEEEKQKRGPKPKPKQTNKCYQCDKEFRCQAQLDMHVRTHTGVKPFGCSYCPRRFTQKHNLTIHARIHTGDKPFQCEVCSKRFSAQGNLQTHLKIHTGQKDHTCTLCNKAFITSSELTRHMCKHRGLKDYKCNICEAAFVQSRDLKLHKFKKHQIEFKTKKKEPAPIDVTDIDVGKDMALTSQDNIDVSYVKPDAKPVEPQDTQRVLRDFQFIVPDKFVCATCGERFDYFHALGQHYMDEHKTFHSSNTRIYSMP